MRTLRLSSGAGSFEKPAKGAAASVVVVRARKKSKVAQPPPGLEDLIGQIQDRMWKDAGIVRTRVGMQEAIEFLEALVPRVAHPRTRRAHEAGNLYLAALLVASSALARKENRGAHYRIDYPGHDDKKFLKHSVIEGESLRFS